MKLQGINILPSHSPFPVILRYVQPPNTKPGCIRYEDPKKQLDAASDIKGK